MARRGEPRIFGRVIVLLFLILILAVGGLIWFDYLNVVDAKAVLGPIYQLIGLQMRTQPQTAEGEWISLDAERMFMHLEALAMRNLEMDQKELDITGRQREIQQMAEELEERQKALDDRENTINVRELNTDDRNRNIEQIARYLTNMPPGQAVGIIDQMDDQNVIDVFRKTEEIAQQEGTVSLVSVWLSMLPPARAAEIQRKMAGRPNSLN